MRDRRPHRVRLRMLHPLVAASAELRNAITPEQLQHCSRTSGWSGGSGVVLRPDARRRCLRLQTDDEATAADLVDAIQGNVAFVAWQVLGRGVDFDEPHLFEVRP